MERKLEEKKIEKEVGWEVGDRKKEEEVRSISGKQKVNRKRNGKRQ